MQCDFMPTHISYPVWLSLIECAWVSFIQLSRVHLQLVTPTPASSSSSTTGVVNKRCFTCGKTVPLSIMRCHLAKHILKGELMGSKICGFFGRDICTITLRETSKKASQHFFKIDQYDCSYFFEYGRAKKFNKKTNPCTNRIDRCCMAGCFSNVWTYNFEEHFKERHPVEVFPVNMAITEAEKKYILNL